MYKILEVSVPYITYTPEVSTLFAILGNHEESFEWLITTFISMGICRTSNIEEMIWVEDYYQKCPFVKYIDMDLTI